MTNGKILRHCADIAFALVVYVVGRWVMEYNGYPDIQWPSYVLGAVIGALSVPK